MSRRVRELSAADLDHLPVACRACVFWEVAGAERGPSAGAPGARSRKEAWWKAVELEWGPPGAAVYRHGRLMAYAFFAPGDYFPQLGWRARAVSDDAVLLATLWVDPDSRGQGLARTLLQAVCGAAHRRRGHAVEAFGGRGLGRLGPCVLPESFLLANGFQVVRDHELLPLLRLDLRQTVRWQESVELALAGVRSALSRRERTPVPARTATAAPLGSRTR